MLGPPGGSVFASPPKPWQRLTFAVNPETGYGIPMFAVNPETGYGIPMTRFRLDSWWFGVPLLVRGPLINLPVVAATDYPPIQVVIIAMVLTTTMVMQMLAWPWKVPMLNLTDCIISFCIVLLVTTSTLYLNKIDDTMYGFATGVSTAMLSGIGAAVGVMVLMTGSALFYRSAMGGKKELAFFNLGKVPSSQDLAKKVKAMADELEKSDPRDLSSKLSTLSVFDTMKVSTCITLLATEVAPPAEDGVSFKFNKRIASASFDPSLKRKPQSRRESSMDDAQKDAQKPEESNEIVMAETNAMSRAKRQAARTDWGNGLVSKRSPKWIKFRHGGDKKRG